MKKFFQYFLIAVALTLMIWGLIPGQVIKPVEAQITDVEEKSILSVQGQGVVQAEPDSARVVFSVITEEKTAQEAQEENSQIMNKVVDTLKEMGIAENKITTQNFRLSPQYNYSNDERQLTGYQVSHELCVEMKDIQKVGTIIDTGIAAGVNRVRYVEFYLEDNQKVYEEALKKAVLEAKEKAQVMADALEMKITGIVSVRESGVYYPEPLRKYYDYAMADIAAKESSADTQINPGELTISASVNIDFKL